MPPCGNFYPRSPCGERRWSLNHSLTSGLFLSTLSLRRATDDGRDSLIERMISIHALLAESDVSGNYNQTVNGISIHALLAESDFPTVSSLPRAASFLSTLSLRRATYDLHGLKMGYCISIHALLAESDLKFTRLFYDLFISIHALLAESDVLEEDFPVDAVTISIHALLAESDCWCWEPGTVTARFLSTLSLRRATAHFAQQIHAVGISIHALLAESDVQRGPRPHQRGYFYPRSPCGERPLLWQATPRPRSFLSTLSLRRATILPLFVHLLL